MGQNTFLKISRKAANYLGYRFLVNNEKVFHTIFFRKGKTDSNLGSQLTDFSSEAKT